MVSGIDTVALTVHTVRNCCCALSMAEHTKECNLLRVVVIAVYAMLLFIYTVYIIFSNADTFTHHPVQVFAMYLFRNTFIILKCSTLMSCFSL